MLKSLLLSALLLFNCGAFYNNTKKTEDKIKEKVGAYEHRDIAPYLKASETVAGWWKTYPAYGYWERVSIGVGYCGVESDFKPDLIHFNIPHKSYPGLRGLQVKHFSVDFSSFGLSSENCVGTYEAAKAIQGGYDIDAKRSKKLGLHPLLIKSLRKELSIPKSLKLYKIDISKATEAHRQYRLLLAKGINPNKMKIHVSYVEKTQDEINCTLLYRFLEEYNRKLMGLPMGRYNSKAYYICEDIVCAK